MSERGSETAAKRREARAQEREARDSPARSPGQAEPRGPRPLSPPPRPPSRPHRKRPVPVRPAGMRCGTRAARPSPGAASAAREPGSRLGLRLPATSALSFFQGHGELAEGIEERAEAAGQAQHHDAQVAPHRAGPRVSSSFAAAAPARPGELERRELHRAAAGATSSSSAAASRPPAHHLRERADSRPRSPDTASAAAGPTPEGGQQPGAPTP